MENIIRLYSSSETVFNHYENIIDNALSFKVEHEENGLFSCDMVCPFDDRITEGKILQGLTPIGLQLFRIIKVKKVISENQNNISVYGRHISYDLLNNFVENVRPTDTTLNNALQIILNGTQYPHPFTATSDVAGLNTANYVRMNPILAIMGQNENSALNRWGGYLKRDNFNLNILATSPNKGYYIELGKNLVGIDEELDLTDVVTRLMPTVVLTDNIVTELPEKYIDSQLINSYPQPIIKELRIELTDDEKLLTLSQVYDLMRVRAQAQYDLKVDEPKVNYSVDFVQLRKTEQYKHLAILEELDVSDTVWVYVPLIGIDVSARVIKYTFDGLSDRFESMELGNFKPRGSTQRADLVQLIESTANLITDGVITAKLKEAMETISGYRGGRAVIVRNEIGEPVAHAFLDTDDLATANEYVIINSQGIAFGNGGLSNPPEVAINIKGEVIANSAFFRSLTTNLISSELGSDLVLTSNEAITGLVSNYNALDGRLGTAELKITPSAITSTVTESATYINALSGKEGSIIKQTTAPAHLLGKLWLNTSVTPNVLNRSSGTAWVKITPTLPGEVGAYSASDGSSLAGRVTTAESSITQNATDITSKVATSTYNTKMGALDSSISTVTQTANDVKFEFENQIIGGRNLIPNSANGVEVYSNDASSFPVVTAVLTDYRRVKRVVPFTTAVLSVYTPIFYDVVAGDTYTVSVDVMSYYTVSSIGIAGGKSFSLSANIWKRIYHTFTASTTGSLRLLGLYSNSLPVEQWLNYRNYKVERGTTYTDWSPWPGEMYSGITEVDEDGVSVGVSNSSVATEVNHDGVRIYDQDKLRANFGLISYVPELDVDIIRGNLINLYGSSTVYNVGSTQTIKTISEVFESIGNYKDLNGATITINVYGTVSDIVTVRGFRGGLIDIVFQTGSRLTGRVYVYDTTARVTIRGTTGGQGTIKIATTGTYACIQVGNSSYVQIGYMNLDGAANPEGRGLIAQTGSNVYIYSSDMGRVKYGMMSYTSSKIFASSNKGSCTTVAFYMSAGAVFVDGTIPVGGKSAGHYFPVGTITETASAFSPPAVTPTVFKRVFKPVSKYTYYHDTTTKVNYYGATGAQGRWEDMATPMDGVTLVGTDIADYWQGGYDISVKMRVRRLSNSHGQTAGVIPSPYNFVGTGFTATARGAWSGWATVSSSYFSTTVNNELKFYSGTLNSGYAIWDDAEIEVTVTKDV